MLSKSNLVVHDQDVLEKDNNTARSLASEMRYIQDVIQSCIEDNGGSCSQNVIERVVATKLPEMDASILPLSLFCSAFFFSVC